MSFSGKLDLAPGCTSTTAEVAHWGRLHMLALCAYAMLVAQGIAQLMEILSAKTHNVPQLTGCSQALGMGWQALGMGWQAHGHKLKALAPRVDHDLRL